MPDGALKKWFFSLKAIDDYSRYVDYLGMPFYIYTELLIYASAAYTLQTLLKPRMPCPSNN